MNGMKLTFFAILLSLLLAIPRNGTAGTGTGNKTVCIWSNGFHTGIIIRIDKQTTRILNLELPDKKYLYMDIGWGELEFYTSRHKTVSTYLKAALIPTRSTVRTELFTRNELRELRARWFVKLKVSDMEYMDAMAFIKKSIKSGNNGKPDLIYKRNGGIINYYASPLKYHILFTCNSWIALMLEKSGIPVNRSMIIENSLLFWRLIQLPNCADMKAE